jgi:hypothetical protein
VRVHEPQPLTRIAFSNVGIDDTLSRPSKFIICVGKLLRTKRKDCRFAQPSRLPDRARHKDVPSDKEKAPVGDTDQGFVSKTWKVAPPSSCLWKAQLITPASNERATAQHCTGSAWAKPTLRALAIEMFAEVCFMKARFYAAIFTSQLRFGKNV